MKIDKIPRRAPIQMEALSESKIRIILAAESLFAQSSIDSVSLREIAARAGQGNNNAVQYHFGTREGLVRAVFAYRMQQMEATRGRMLALAESEGRLGDLRSIIDMVFLPQLELQDTDGNHSYANFLCQYLLRRRFVMYGDFGSPAPPNLERILALLRERLGHLPPNVAQRRLVGVSLVFLNILVMFGDAVAGGDGESIEAALEDTLNQIVAAIGAPLA